MTFSCTRLKGPPLREYPIRLAGTVRQYSKKAIPHENRITNIRGHPVDIFISLSFRCPYQAKVMKTFDITSISIVTIAFTAQRYCKYRFVIFQNREIGLYL